MEKETKPVKNEGKAKIAEKVLLGQRT